MPHLLLFPALLTYPLCSLGQGGPAMKPASMHDRCCKFKVKIPRTIEPDKQADKPSAELLHTSMVAWMLGKIDGFTLPAGEAQMGRAPRASAFCVAERCSECRG